MPGVLNRLGDALAGVDRQGAFMQGMQDRADYDYRNSATEQALETASLRRSERMLKEQERQARARIAQATPEMLTDPNSPLLGSIMSGGMGSDFASAQQGRQRIQDYNLGELIADPLTPDNQRLAALESRAPASAATARLGDLFDTVTSNELEIVQGDDGMPTFVLAADAIGRRAGARPTTRTGGGDGLYESADTNAIYKLAAGRFGGLVDDQGDLRVLDPTVAPSILRLSDRASKIFGMGNVPHATAVAMAYDELFGAGASSGDDPNQEYADGTIIANDEGQQMIMQNGQWVEYSPTQRGRGGVR